jgi:hypothetical protein
MGTEKEIDELFDKAIRLEKDCAWEQAISLYDQAVERWPDRAEAVYAKNSAARLREMLKDSSRPAEQVRGERRRSASLAYQAWSHRGIRVSIGVALAMLSWDVVLAGSFVASLLICPIWFLFSIAKNAIQRPGWRLALFRIAVPVLTLGLVLANNNYQYRIGEANAPKIITACEEFNAANGRYPKSLDELVPRYMPSIPCAKHCLSQGNFLYIGSNGSHMLVWCVIPPYGRKIYDFEQRQWRYLD